MPRVSPLLLVVSCLLIIALTLLQWSHPLIIGADGYLHSYMARKASHHWGLVPELPQAHFSYFATRFSNKDFLYHLYLAPFVALMGEIHGTKLGAVVAASLLYIAVAILLVRISGNNIYSLLAFSLLLSAQFVRDTMEARPFMFAILLTLIGIYAIARHKSKFSFGIALLYGMTHLSAWLLPFIAILVAFLEWISEGKKLFKLVGYTLAGYALSFLLHPNFPNNIWYFYLNGILVPIYAAQTGVLELGAEFFPLYTRDLFTHFPFMISAAILVFLAASLGLIKENKPMRDWGIAVVVLICMGLVAKRNLTHLYPVFIVWFGLCLVALQKQIKNISLPTRQRIWPQGLVLMLLLTTLSIYQAAQTLPSMLWSEQLYAHHFNRIAGAIREQAAPGSRVFHSNWSDSQYLIGLAPQYEYIVTLDPIYMYAWNPQLYQLYRQVSFGQTQDSYAIIKNTFGSSIVYAGKNYFSTLISEIKHDRRFQLVYEDELGIVALLR